METKISLSAVRKNAGMTQTDIANKMQVCKATVSNWESGRVKIDFDQAVTFCRICNDFPIQNLAVPE